MTPHLDAVALLPEITLTALLGIVFVVDLFLGETRKKALTSLTAVGLLVPLACTIALGIASHHANMAGSSYVVDDFALLAKGLFLVTTLAVVLFGAPQDWKGEYFVLLLASALGMVMVVSARDLLTFFVTFELLAVPGYLLVGWNKRSKYGHEAALKYYLLGVLATAVMLYGLSLLFGLAGGTKFTEVSQAFADGGDHLALARIALFFVIVGMAFKVSAVPFHFWAPDAYQGAPVAIAAFLSVASKAAGLLALVELVTVAFPNAASVWAPLLYGLSIATMTVGNLIALRQQDFVRLLAYSSIAQAGYMLIPLAIAGQSGNSMSLAVETIFQFLIIYAVMNLGAFVIVHVSSRRTGDTSIAKFQNLFARSPFAAIALSCFLLALAGIPPLGGWFAKLLVFRAGIAVHTAPGVVLVVVAAVNSAIGLAYYARVIRQLWAKDESADQAIEQVPMWSPGTTIVAALTLGAVVIFGVLPGLVTYVGGVSSLAK